MAYLKTILVRCEYGSGCSKRPTVELYNRRNALLGAYCARHGNEKLYAAQAREKKEDESR